MLSTMKPNGLKHGMAQAIHQAMETLCAGWRAWRTRLHCILISVFGHNQIAAEPANDAFMLPPGPSPLVRGGRTSARELAARLAVTQGSRLVLVFIEERCASVDETSSQWITEPHFMNLCRDRALDRRLGSPGPRAYLRRGQSRI
jgi:hypothetical protein